MIDADNKAMDDTRPSLLNLISFLIAIVLTSQMLTGCASDDDNRLKVLAEAELHCDMPSGSLQNLYSEMVRRNHQMGFKDPFSDPKVIYFGAKPNWVSERQVMCIKQVASNLGYTMMIRYHSYN